MSIGVFPEKCVLPKQVFGLLAAFGLHLGDILLRFLMRVRRHWISDFSHCNNKIPDQSNLKEEKCFFGLQFEVQSSEQGQGGERTKSHPVTLRSQSGSRKTDGGAQFTFFKKKNKIYFYYFLCV